MSNKYEAWKTKHITLSALAEAQVRMFNECASYAASARSTHSWVFSHTTALQLLGIELPNMPSSVKQLSPRRKHHPYSLTTLHISFLSNSARSRRAGITTHTCSLPFAPVILGEGILAVPPLVAWAQMAQHLEVSELVVLGDSMMRKDPRQKVATLADFERFMVNTPPFRGKAACRKALTLMAENTDSSQESRLRLILIAHHFGTPQVNYKVFDPEKQQSYYLDLAYPLHNLGLEYQGRQHLKSIEQQRNDMFKESRLTSLDWTVLPVYYEDLTQPDRFDLLLSKIIAHCARVT
jgi:very-short-patch-repair endonuclease